MNKQGEEKVLIAGLDIQAEKTVCSLMYADQINDAGRKLIDEANRIRRQARSFIRLELHEDGLISIQVWREGRLDAFYPPRLLECVLRDVNVAVRDLQQPDPHSSSDEQLR